MDKLKDEKFAKFYMLFLKTVAEKYTILENLRRKCITEHIEFCKLIKYCIMISILSFFISLLDSAPDIPMAFFSFAFLFILGLYLGVIRANKNFQVGIKKVLLPILLPFFGKISWNNKNELCGNYYLSSCPISISRLKNSGLFLEFNRYSVDDIIKGQYNDVDFKVAEIKLLAADEAETSKSIPISCFRGIVLTYDFNKKVRNNTIVSAKSSNIQRSGLRVAILTILAYVLTNFLICFLVSNFNFLDTIKSMFNWFNLLIWLIIFLVYSYDAISTVLFGFIRGYKKYPDKVTLEYSKFNNKFKVYSSDEVEARYLATPAFMEKFYNLKTAFGAKNIRCSFFDVSLIIAIETRRDLFELGSIFKPVKDVKTIENFYDEITAIFDMIDYFKLNEDIYLK